MELLNTHLQRLQERFQGATLTALGGSGSLIRVPDVELPDGWSKPKTTVVFVAPPAYPMANLDSFWADSDLRLAHGGVPRNAQVGNTPPGTSEPLLWFSWHLQHPWNPNRDDFLTWMAVVNQRFVRPE